MEEYSINHFQILLLCEFWFRLYDIEKLNITKFPDRIKFEKNAKKNIETPAVRILASYHNWIHCSWALSHTHFRTNVHHFFSLQQRIFRSGFIYYFLMVQFSVYGKICYLSNISEICHCVISRGKQGFN